MAYARKCHANDRKLVSLHDSGVLYVCVVSQGNDCSKSVCQILCLRVCECVCNFFSHRFARENFLLNPKWPQWRRLCPANLEKRNERTQMGSDLFQDYDVVLKARDFLPRCCGMPAIHASDSHYTYWQKMYNVKLWIKASAKCINVNAFTSLYEKCHGIFNDHRESGPQFNVSSERRHR